MQLHRKWKCINSWIEFGDSESEKFTQGELYSRSTGRKKKSYTIEIVLVKNGYVETMGVR